MTSITGFVGINCEYILISFKYFTDCMKGVEISLTDLLIVKHIPIKINLSNRLKCTHSHSLWKWHRVDQGITDIPTIIDVS